MTIISSLLLRSICLTTLHLVYCRNGSTLALGSDFPVELVNPWHGIHSAVKRTSPVDGTSPHGPGGWSVAILVLLSHSLTHCFLHANVDRYASEALTLTQALRGFTINGAFASFQEHRTGSLELGKEADFIIIDRDLKVTADLAGTKVVATVLAGNLVYGHLAGRGL